MIDTPAVEQKIRTAIAVVQAMGITLCRHSYNYDHDSDGRIVIDPKKGQCCPMTAVAVGAPFHTTSACAAWQRLGVPFQWVEGFVCGWDNPDKTPNDFAGYGAYHRAGFEVGQKLSKEYLP